MIRRPGADESPAEPLAAANDSSLNDVPSEQSAADATAVAKIKIAAAAFRRSLYAAEDARAKYYFHRSPKADAFVETHGDVAFMRRILDEFDGDIERVNHATVSVKVDGPAGAQTFDFDEEVTLTDGSRVLRVYGRTAPDREAQRVAEALAAKIGAQLEWVHEGSVSKRVTEFYNCLLLTGYINRAWMIVERTHAVRALQSVLEVRDAIRFRDLEIIARTKAIDAAVLFAEVAEMIAAGHLHVDLQKPITRRKLIARSELSSKASTALRSSRPEGKKSKPTLRGAVKLRKSFGDLPSALLDLSAWKKTKPEIDEELFNRRCAAVDMYFDGASDQAIKDATRFTEVDVCALIRLGAEPMPDGSPKGYRAFRRGGFARPYRRERAERRGLNIERSRGGNSGLMTRYFETFPDDYEALISYFVGESDKRGRKPKIRPNYQQVFVKFKTLAEARVKAGELPGDGYPFNTAENGKTALYRHLKDLERGEASRVVAGRGGPKEKRAARLHSGRSPLFTSGGLLQVVAADFYKSEGFTELRLRTPKGGIVSSVLPRWWLGAFLDVYVKGVLSSTFSFEKNPVIEDVLDLAAAMALTPSDDPTLAERHPKVAADGKWQPNQILKELEHQGFDLLCLDRAYSHAAREVLSKLVLVFGCAICFGSVGDWYQRPDVERAFRDFAQQLRTLKSGVGPRPGEDVYSDAVANAIKYEIDFQRAQVLFKALMRERLTARGASSQWAGQLATMQELCKDEDLLWMPRPIAIARIDDCPFSWVNVDTKIERRSRVAHVREQGIYFSNGALRNCSLPAGHRCTLQIGRTSVTQARLIDAERGEHLGPVHIAKAYSIEGLPWRVVRMIESRGRASGEGLGAAVVEFADAEAKVEEDGARRPEKQKVSEAARLLAQMSPAAEAIARKKADASKPPAAAFSTLDYVNRLRRRSRTV